MKIVKAAVVLLVGLLLITAFACGGGSEQGSAPAGWATYSNSSLGFSIQYPQDWIKAEGQAGTIVAFKSPWINTSVPRGGLFICVYADIMPLNEYLNVWIANMEAQVQGFNLSESSASTFAGTSAHVLVYTRVDDNESVMKTMDITSIKNNRMYKIFYMSDESVYPDYLTTAQQMIDSFKFD